MSSPAQIQFANEVFEPAYDDIGQAREALGGKQDDALAEMYEYAQRVMKDKSPEAQTYMMRLDKKTVIKTEAEYGECVKNNVPIRFGISHGHATQLLHEEEARSRLKAKVKQKRKTAKASRKRNRRK